MLIKTETKKENFFLLQTGLFKKKKAKIIGFTLILALMSLFLVILIKPDPIRPYLSELKTFTLEQQRHLAGIIFAKPKELSIDINWTNYQKISDQRQRAVNAGVLLEQNTEFLPAKLTYNGQSYDIKLRLKGAGFDHWDDDKKWSLKMRISNQKSILGMTDFSIMHPKTRNYIYEWLYAKALEKEGFLFPRVEFVKVAINGRNHGIYVLEEDFSKALVENNKRREGALIGFDKSLVLEEWARGNTRQEIFSTGMTGGFKEMQSEVIPSNFEAVEPISVLAIKLLEDFRAGKVNVSQAFDIDSISKFFALRALFASLEFDPNDVKFYYNPITDKLEVYSAEINRFSDESARVGNWWVNEGFDREKRFTSLFFKDPEFLRRYVQYLNSYASDDYFDKMLGDLKSDLGKNLNIIYSEFPASEFREASLFTNQKYIQDSLNPPKALHAYFREENTNGLKIDIGSLYPFPIEVEEVSYKGGTYKGTQKIILSERNPDNTVQYQTFDFIRGNTGTRQEEITIPKIYYKILGIQSPKEADVASYSFFPEVFQNRVMSQGPNVAEFDNLFVDNPSKTIIARRGTWNLDRNLIIPSGYTFELSEETTINLTNGAKIISYSPLQFKGSEQSPIFIRSGNQSGQGIVVINAQNESHLENVVFENLTNPKENGWELTGAVTFYQSPVYINQCLFKSNNSEDTLNIIRSDFEIVGSAFTDTSSDAIDTDFASGTISQSIFTNTAGDAMDFSEGNVNVNAVKIRNAGDKGISVGENSRVQGEEIEINKAYIGIAAKDNSTVNVKGINIKSADWGLTVYQKKLQFGTAHMVVTGLKDNFASTPYLVEEGSTLNVDYKEIPAEGKNVFIKLYPDETE